MRAIMAKAAGCGESESLEREPSGFGTAGQIEYTVVTFESTDPNDDCPISLVDVSGRRIVFRVHPQAQ